MYDNKKKVLRLVSLLFAISLLFVILINIYELNMLRGIVNNRECIYIAMSVKIILISISFVISFILIVNLFNKEVNHDYMTGLCSRRKLFFDLNELIIKKMQFTLCYIDFNDFKYINDNYGHKAGDMLLKEFSRRIYLLKHMKITGYRIGGDEFVIIIKNNQEIESCIQNIWKVTEEDVKITSSEFAKIGFAMGIVENDFVSTADELVKKADSNMYENKRT